MSDTHGFIHPRVSDFFKDCDEIWHAGDIGNLETADQLSKLKPFKAVYGNIDGGQLRSSYPEYEVFFCENVKVLMIHIGGYPGRYNPKARKLIEDNKPKLFISGHSHILKVMPDKKHKLLHINPGAAGNSGLHKSITMVRFVIDKQEIKDLEVLDIKRD
jgi:putative phosphoesterase